MERARTTHGDGLRRTVEESHPRLERALRRRARARSNQGRRAQPGRRSGAPSRRASVLDRCARRWLARRLRATAAGTRPVGRGGERAGAVRRSGDCRPAHRRVAESLCRREAAGDERAPFATRVDDEAARRHRRWKVQAHGPWRGAGAADSQPQQRGIDAKTHGDLGRDPGYGQVSSVNRCRTGVSRGSV